jgi:hypothetical protein
MRVYLVRFIDSANVDWRVREETARPEGPLADVVAWHRRRLRFESVRGLRYLRPVPEGWEKFTPAQLEALCYQAEGQESAA